MSSRSAFARPRPVAVFLAVAALFAAAARGAEVDFARDVRPLLNQHCTSCHGGVKKAGGVSFLFRESAMAPGKSGEVPFKPGD